MGKKKALAHHTSTCQRRTTEQISKKSLLIGQILALILANPTFRQNLHIRQKEKRQICVLNNNGPIFLFSSHTSTFQLLLLDKPWSQVSSLPPPRFLPSIFIAHRFQQSHCSSIWIFHRVLLTHALALSASQLVHKKSSPRIYTSMHSAGLELTKLTYTRLEDNLIPGTPPGRLT